MRLEKFNYNAGKGKRMFLYGFILCAILMILINLFFSQAKYLNVESLKIAEGTINYKPYDFKIIAMYQESEEETYGEIETMPTSGYTINEEKSYCTLDNVNKDNNATLKTSGSKHTIENISPNDKCYLYFDRIIISNIQDIINSKTIARRTDFSTPLTKDTTGLIFVTPDNDGDSFYFAGSVQDNWVKFAGFYWRIIRINGDGTLRMIYSGTEESGPAITGEVTQIGTSAFNENYNDNAYVGYMYGTPGSSTYEETHANINNSTIKTFVDTWYEQNLINYASYIDTNASFCSDRTYTGAGFNKSYTSYGSYIRLMQSTNPTLKCQNNNDNLKIPIGLLTGDEVAFAGGVFNYSNSSFYLYTAIEYYLSAPSAYLSGNNTSYEMSVHQSGALASGYVSTILGVRPVINLKADTVFLSGNGTSTNPYVVSN